MTRCAKDVSAGRVRAFAAAAALVALASCTLFADEDEPQAPPQARHLDVVDDAGPFDPSEAVDDPGEKLALDVDAEGAQEKPKGDAERERGADLRPGEEEDVATPERAEEIEASREAAVAAADGAEDGADDEEAKVAIARNPPPQESAEQDPPFLTAADLTFDTLLVASAAAAVALAWTFALGLGPRGRWIAAGALALVLALGAWLVVQAG